MAGVGLYNNDDSNDDDGPSAAQCAQRCEEFVQLTNSPEIPTNTAIAQSYLQDHKWNVELSIIAYYNALDDQTSVVGSRPGPKPSSFIELDNAPDYGGLCGQFVELTDTNREIAMTYLAANNWDLTKSAEAFFGQSPSRNLPSGSRSPGLLKSNTPSSARKTNHQDDDTPHKRPRSEPLDGPIQSATTSAGEPVKGQGQANGEPAASLPFKLITWNIDGLDDKSIAFRARAVVTEITKELPDVVFLQEVVDENLAVIRSSLHGTYEIIASEGVLYYSAILLRKTTVRLEKAELIDFHRTGMGRNLRYVLAAWNGVPLALMTSHLESGKESAAERTEQLRTCFDRMLAQGDDRVVIFGGDLNLREPEVKQVGLPKSVKDLWEACGSRSAAQWTFDCRNNTNASELFPNLQFKIHCRYDRLYYRPTTGHGSCPLKPANFGLVGLTKPPGSQRNISDHFGIVVTFDRQ